MPFTHFHDMHSGGGCKEKWGHIYIEASENDAVKIFYAMFDHNPHRVSCTCCGADYSLSEEKTLREVTAFERGCDYDEKKKKYVEKPSKRKFAWNKYMTLAKFKKREDIRIITKKEFPEGWQSIDVPEQGYVWQG